MRFGEPSRLTQGATPSTVASALTPIQTRNQFRLGQRSRPDAAHSATPIGTITATASTFGAWNGPNAAGTRASGVSTTSATAAHPAGRAVVRSRPPIAVGG